MQQADISFRGKEGCTQLYSHRCSYRFYLNLLSAGSHVPLLFLSLPERFRCEKGCHWKLNLPTYHEMRLPRAKQNHFYFPLYRPAIF